MCEFFMFINVLFVIVYKEYLMWVLFWVVWVVFSNFEVYEYFVELIRVWFD